MQKLFTKNLMIARQLWEYYLKEIIIDYFFKWPCNWILKPTSLLGPLPWHGRLKGLGTRLFSSILEKFMSNLVRMLKVCVIVFFQINWNVFFNWKIDNF